MSSKVLLKLLQRKLYSFLLHPLGCLVSVVCVALWGAWITTLVFGGSLHAPPPLPSSGVFMDFTDNIGGINQQHHLAYGPIDVVYTWVNGTDPRWMKKKKLWEQRLFGEEPVVLETNNTGNGTQIDDSRSANRYRDSQELRYSLRSLVKYAPWIRKIYLVTDNQIPHWLNLETERLRVVSHSEIFPNKSHLPVFSSPAIETHLHRLPGLSDKFIYFNDDVMLGAPTFPEDFVSVSGTQKVYLSWEVPKCAPGCSEAWIGDGYCDRACNVTECNFDFPDCVNKTEPESRFRGDTRKQSHVHCSKGCPDTWLGDRVCDNRCSKEECAFDAGDCGINAFADKLPGVIITRDNALILTERAVEAQNKEHLQAFANAVPSFAADPPIAMSIPAGTTSAYFNLSSVFPTSSNLTFDKATFTNPELVHNAIFIRMHRILVVLFYHGQEGAPPSPPLPTHTVVTFKGSEGNYSTTTIFRIAMLPKHVLDVTTEMPERMGTIDGFVSDCNRRTVPASSGVEIFDKFLSTIPFRTQSRSSTDEGIVLNLRLRGPQFHAKMPAKSVVVRSTVTFPGNMTGIVMHHPLLVVAGGKSLYSDMNIPVQALTRNLESSSPEDQAALEKWQMTTPPEDRLGRLQAELERAAVNDTIDLRLALPVPKAWAEMEDKEWLHHQVELLVHPNEEPDRHSYLAVCVVAMHSWGNEREPEPERERKPSEPESVLPNLGFAVRRINNYNASEADHHDQRRRLQLNLQQATTGPAPTEYPIRIVADDGLPTVMLSQSLSSFSSRRLRTERPVSDEESYAEQKYLTTPSSHPNSIRVPKVEEPGILSAGDWWMQTLQQYALLQEANRFAPPHAPHLQPQQRQQRRRLQDTYAKSLVHVNRLYTKAFGAEQRKVPAHMPHMIDKNIMSEMQDKWKDEWEATSTHRFRSPHDMQYAFAYFFYVMNRNKLVELNVVDYLSTEIDTNHDGVIDKNEQRTLATLISADPITQTEVDALEFCIAPPLLQTQARENRTVLLNFQPTIADAANCTLVQDGIQKRARRPATHELGPTEEISFEMIGDDFNHSMAQLDSIRTRRTKFICVNDDMKNPSLELQKAFADFFEALFPLPCQFELPAGEANPTLYLDEYNSLKGPTVQPRAYSAFEVLEALRMYQPAIAFGLCVFALVAFVIFRQQREPSTQQAAQHSPRRREQATPSPTSKSQTPRRRKH